MGYEHFIKINLYNTGLMLFVGMTLLEWSQFRSQSSTFFGHASIFARLSRLNMLAEMIHRLHSIVPLIIIHSTFVITETPNH